MYRVMLNVDGLDLAHERTLERLAQAPEEMAWSYRDGQVRVTLFPPGPDPAGYVIEVVHWFEHAFEHAHVAQVDEEFKSTSDIAAELSLSRETVRMWAQGKRGPGGFPRPRGTVGGGTRGPVRFWAWADVARWLTDYMLMELDYEAISADEVAEINAHLKRVSPRQDDGGPDVEWRSLGQLAHQSSGASLHPIEEWDDTYRTPLSVDHVCPINAGTKIEVTARYAGARR